MTIPWFLAQVGPIATLIFVRQVLHPVSALNIKETPRLGCWQLFVLTTCELGLTTAPPTLPPPATQPPGAPLPILLATSPVSALRFTPLYKHRPLPLYSTVALHHTSSSNVPELVIPISPEQAAGHLPRSRASSSPYYTPRVQPNGAGGRYMDRDSPRRERGHSNGSVALTNGYHSSPSPVPTICPALRMQFAKLRDDLASASSRDETLSLISAFIVALPSFYSDAAQHFVLSRRRAGLGVNIDALAEHFSLLDQTAAVASPRAEPRRKSNGPLSMSPSRSPIKLPSPVAHVPSHELKGFAPSRPNVANLLMDDEQRPHPPAATDEGGGGKQALR